MSRFTGKVSKAFILILLIGICAVSAWASGNSASAAPSAASVTASGYPIVTDGSVTLKYFLGLNPVASKYIRSYDENLAFQELQKKTGIKLSFIHPVAGQEAEAFNMMIASQDLPDLIEGPERYRGGEAAGVRDGVFLELTPYVQQYAPDYYKMIKSDPKIWRDVTTPENLLPAFYQIKPVSDPALMRIMVRDDLIKDLGFNNLPVTIADYTAIFKAYKDKTGKGGLIPVENGREKYFIGAYNVFPNFYKDNGKIKFGPYEAGYRAYLQQFADWYKLGYINNDFPSLKNPQRQSMFQQGDTLAINGGIDNFLIWAKDLKIGTMPTLYPRINMGDKLHVYDWEVYPVKAEGKVAIFNNTKYKTEAVRFLNYGYTTEGSIVYDFGVEGVTYNMVNGKPQLNDFALNNPEYPPEAVNYILKIFHGPKVTRTGIECNPNTILFPDVFAIKQQFAQDPDVDSDFTLPNYSLAADDVTRAGKIMTDVNTYVDEMTLKFITGAEPLSRFDAYIAQLKSYGIEDAIAMNQKAFDNYMSKN
ncbi:MAG: extracellular solute-binding protein [Treponema sp.]|nr:extracellular solute-binding protein [Treponema sp.]